MTLFFNKLESDPLYQMCKAWLQLVLWFWRGSRKCKTFRDMGYITLQYPSFYNTHLFLMLYNCKLQLLYPSIHFKTALSKNPRLLQNTFSLRKHYTNIVHTKLRHNCILILNYDLSKRSNPCYICLQNYAYARINFNFIFMLDLDH